MDNVLEALKGEKGDHQARTLVVEAVLSALLRWGCNVSELEEGEARREKVIEECMAKGWRLENIIKRQ
jgi:hypothetical protein